MGYQPMQGAVGEAEIAACMGLSPEEYQGYTNPTNGEMRQPTKEEMKRQAKAAGKVNVARYQACMMRLPTSE